MDPAILPETTHNRGDLWEDGYRSFGPVLIDGVAPSLPALYCRMQFRQRKADTFGYELNTSPGSNQGTIIISDAAAYIFEIPAQTLPLEAGVWDWDFEVYTTVGHTDPPRTFWRGSVKVTKDVSHD